ncbi:MAG: DUF2202 domain-containing protein [Candidatus Gracilibacteria bacterium]|nr:DUF2202 domain-containing protein [Candidatus Gracilibacteria bacterium]
MKNTRKILAAIVASAIILSGTVSTYAMGNGNGQGMGKGQHMQEGDKGENPANMLTGVATGTLSDVEKQELYYGYSEEKVAHDLYAYFYSLYGTQTFQNIANSESQHMAAVKTLLDRYSLETPKDYGTLQSTFDSLKAEGEKSLQSALEVGLKVEMLDIDDITKTIKSTDNNDFKIVFTNIGGASYNHMRGFLKALNNNGLTTSIDYSSYLSQDELNTKGSLKNKLSEKLVSEGVSLPSQVNQDNKAKTQDKNIKASDKQTSTIDKKIENSTSLTSKIKEKTLNMYHKVKAYLSGLFK